MNNDTIWVMTATTFDERGDLFSREIDVQVLADRVSVFVSQLDLILASVPESSHGFVLSEFTVSAEISGEGDLRILGSGIKTGLKGGLTFTFARR